MFHSSTIVPVSYNQPHWGSSQVIRIAHARPTWKSIGKIATKRVADNYMKDTRDWPDPTEPRAAKPPAPDCCTCHTGDKLHCPVHGMDAPHDGFEDSWANVQQANPVGYPQDAPRNFNFNLMHSSIEPVIRINNTEGLEDNPNNIDGDENAVIGNEASDPHLKHRHPNTQAESQTWQQTYGHAIPVKRIRS